MRVLWLLYFAAAGMIAAGVLMSAGVGAYMVIRTAITGLPTWALLVLGVGALWGFCIGWITWAHSSKSRG